MQDEATVKEQVIRPIGITEALKYRLRNQYENVEGYYFHPTYVADFYRVTTSIHYYYGRFIDSMIRHG